MRLLELILRRANATRLPQHNTLHNSTLMEDTSSNNMTQPTYGPVLGDSLLTECMPQLGNFLGSSDDCLNFDALTFESSHLTHSDGPLRDAVNKEYTTETSSALATLLQSHHVLTSGIHSSTSTLSLLTQVSPTSQTMTSGDSVSMSGSQSSSSTVASGCDPVAEVDKDKVTFTLDSFETMSVNIINEPSSARQPEPSGGIDSQLQCIDDELNVFHLADREEIDITNFPLFNLDDALLENGIDAQDMSSLLEQFEASAEGSASTELPTVNSLPSLSAASSGSQVAPPSMPRSASTTVLTEVREVTSGPTRKTQVDKILRSASDNCLRSTKSCTTNKPGKPHVTKLCSNRAKNAKLAQKTAAIIDMCTELPVHKSSSEALLRRHQGSVEFKTGGGKHRSRQRTPNQTVSAPTSPAPSPRTSPSRDIIRKIKASSQKRKGAIMLADPLPTRAGRSSRKPQKTPGVSPPSSRDDVTCSVDTVAGSDSDGSLLSDASSGLTTGGNFSDGQQKLSASKKISISLYRSRLQQRRQAQGGAASGDSGGSGRTSPCEVNMNYYDQIADHDYCQNVPLCNTEPTEAVGSAPAKDKLSVSAIPLGLVSGSGVLQLSEFDINAALAACKKDKEGETIVNKTTTVLPPSGHGSAESFGSTSVASCASATDVKEVAVEIKTRARRDTITEVVDMDIESDDGGCHGDTAGKHASVCKSQDGPLNVICEHGDTPNVVAPEPTTAPSHKPKSDLLESIAEKEMECSSPDVTAGQVSAPQLVDTTVTRHTCSNTSVEEGKDTRYSRFSSERQETVTHDDRHTPSNKQVSCDRQTSSDKQTSSNDRQTSSDKNNTGFKHHSGRSRRQNYRRNNRSPYHKDEDYYDKVPHYFTTLSVKSQVTQPIKRVHSGLQLVDETLPGRDRDPSPNRNDPVYDKLPAYYSCFTNSMRYDGGGNGDPLAINGDDDSASNSGYSSRSSSVSTDTRGSSRGRSLSISSSWSCSSRSCSREPPSSYRSSRSSWQRQRSHVHRQRSYSSSSRSRSRSRSSRSRSPLSRSPRSSRSYSRHRSYSGHRSSYSRHSRSRSHRSRSRHRHRRRHHAKHRTRSRSSSEELRPSQRAKLQMRQIEERRIVYVGRIPNTYTKGDLRRRFGRFGVIEDVSVHFREHGDNYGFVTFEYTCDAFAAKENGNKVPGCETFDLCFGGRRHFCRSNYADLDGNMEDEEEMCGVMPKQPTADLDFDALLRQATKTLKTKQRH